MSGKALKVLGLVGIRSGSKSIPDKNIKPLAGKPLVGWVLEAAQKAKHINRVIVSTDSPKYAEIARTFGAETPVLRPPELASDLSPEFFYIKHMIEWLRDNENYQPDIVVRAMATVPLQAPEDLDAVVEELINDPEADSAVVVSEARQHPQKALKIVPDGRGGSHLVTYFTESSREVTPLARQSYERPYFRANVIAFRPEVIFRTDSLTGDRVKYHIIPQERAIDVDNHIDFFILEQLIKKQNEEKSI